MTTFEYTSKAENTTSSAISAIAHNNLRSELFVRFVNESEVVYRDVSESTYNLFAKADSLGKFYNQYISGKFTAIEHSYDTELVSHYDVEAALVGANGVSDASFIHVGDYPQIGDPSPWISDTTTTISIPEPPVSKYKVHWEDAEGTTGSSATFEATSEDNAIVLFFESVAAANRIGLSLVYQKENDVHVTAVTHYIG